MKIRGCIFILLVLLSAKCYPLSQIDTSIRASFPYQMKAIHIPTRWAKEVTTQNVLNEYPRPQMERKNWQNLNGLWAYAITDSSATIPQKFDGSILVPYPIESALSGVKKMLRPEQRLWYKRNIRKPIINATERLVLNVGAIDWQATIYINNQKVMTHTGGYISFSVDITDYLKHGDNDLVIKVYDPTDRGLNPHGKQVLIPQNIYYTPSSGIWQTIWLEKVPVAHISSVKTTPDIDQNILYTEIELNKVQSGMKIEANVVKNGKVVSQEKIPVSPSKKNILNIPIPNAQLWSPDDPFLYDLSIKLVKNDKTIDEIKSYFGMRKIDIQKDEKGADRIFLNNKYTYNLGTLDQGFWPEGLYTAPTDEALAFDIKAIKMMGFNTIRKHIKIEPERWYYHADKIGILVWQDFVNPPQNLPEGSKTIFEQEVRETMDQLRNHPCITTWVVFNERWGAYDQQRLTEWVKKYDPSRLVNGHSGELLYVNGQLREPSDNPWSGSDMTDVHSYPDPRMPPGQPGKAKVVGEFGGVGVSVFGHEWDDMQGWGYIQSTAAKLKEDYRQMTIMLKKLEVAGISASIYTQPFDVEGEENGLLTYDREIIKIPLTEIRDINKSLVTLSKGFNIDPNFYIAANINANTNDASYAELLNQYENGVKDSAFLRRLTLMSIHQKNQTKMTQISTDYIASLRDPFSKENLSFISKITTSTQDKGFELFVNQPEKVNRILGPNYAEYKVRKIINTQEIEPNIITPNPAWDSLHRAIKEKYGQLGEETLYGRQMIYYLTVSHEWEKFAKYYCLYFKTALKRPEYLTNNISWAVFENINDPEVLNFAVQVMKHDLETWDQNNPQAHDTYANLLYKLKSSDEAIKWEEKALQLNPGPDDAKLYAETLQKMKAGQPTWPQNN